VSPLTAAAAFFASRSLSLGRSTLKAQEKAGGGLVVGEAAAAAVGLGCRQQEGTQPLSVPLETR